MGLDDAIKKLKFDKRLLDFNLKNNVISQQEYDSYIKQLTDLKDHSESLKLGLMEIDSDNDTKQSH